MIAESPLVSVAPLALPDMDTSSPACTQHCLNVTHCHFSHVCWVRTAALAYKNCISIPAYICLLLP